MPYPITEEDAVLPPGYEDRLSMLVTDGLPNHRRLELWISLADERRLRASIARFNEQVPDDPLDPTSDEDLAIAFSGCALRGLDAGESDDGVWADLDGTLRALPRRVRSPWWLRLRFAWRSAVRTWRST
jgi:hypothetical protein